MAATLTPKQEAFCLKYVELGNATDAYYAAYNAGGSKPVTANRCAKTLLDNPKIAARLRELRQMHVDRHVVTVDSITQELEDARRLAMSSVKGASAAVSASLGKAKLHGLITDKQETHATVTISTKEQRDAAVAAALAADT